MPSSGNSNPEREQRIFDAAAELFAHYGYAKTTIDDIAERAGVSKGAVYLHFRSKDDLLDRLLLRLSDQMMEDLIKQIESDPQGMTLFTLYRYSMLAVKTNPLLRALYIQDKRVLGDYLRRLQNAKLTKQTSTFTKEFIEQFQRAGLVREDVNLRALAYVLQAIRYGVLLMDDQTMGSETATVEEIGETIGYMLQTSFGTEKGNSEAGKQAFLLLFAQAKEVFEQMGKARGND